MALPTIFDICEPRPDILDASRPDADVAADLAAVLRGSAPREYQDAALFFANTYPTKGVRELLAAVARRLAGASGAAIFRLDTNYGGGKTHALIALSHLASQGRNIAGISEFVDPELLPAGSAKVAAFDGEISDPANGRALGLNIFAKTPWGELAYALAGEAGYERVRHSDQSGIAPGSETLRELIGDGPVLILMDEMGVWLRKASPEIRPQFTAFLGALIKAVENSPKAALVYTLALGKLESQDAFRAENEALAGILAEAMSVSARKETLLDPTAEEETVRVLQRRLFKGIDQAKAAQVVDEYIRLWNQNREGLPRECQLEQVRQSFRLGYPLHPELMETFTAKTATLANFQRVRGMLRILGRAVQRLWQMRPEGVHALQLNRIDFGDGQIRQEITSRLKQDSLVPCLKADVAAAAGDSPSQAEQLDERYYRGMAPYASSVARAIFTHSLAYNEALQGVTRERLRYALLSPAMQAAFIDDAVAKFQDVSLYLDDRPGVPLRFSAEPNLNALVAQFERRIEPAAVRSHLREQTERVFRGNFFALAPFPATAAEAPDTSEKPVLAVISPDAGTGGAEAPELARRIWTPQGEKPRLNLNNIVFAVADSRMIELAREASRRKLALDDLLKSPLLRDLSREQERRVQAMRDTAGRELAEAIQKAYRHIYYPFRDAQGSIGLDHLVLELPRASSAPGDGERQIIESLKSRKLRLGADSPGSTRYLISRTSLRKGKASIAALWADFHEDPGLPMLEQPRTLQNGLKQALAEGGLVYKKGELVAGPGEPVPQGLGLGDDEIIYTLEQAMAEKVWPRQQRRTGYLAGFASLKDGQASLRDIRHEHMLDKEPDRPDFEEELAEGIGQGQFVCADGNAVWARGTDRPQTLSDSATIYTASQARQLGIWPRPGAVTIRAGAAGVTIGEAFGELFEKMASQGVSELASLTVEAFTAQDGFALARLAQGLPHVKKTVRLEASWANSQGADFNVALEHGSCQDASDIGQFVQPQLRAAAEQSFSLALVLEFEEQSPDLAAIRARLDKAGAAFLVATGRA